MRSKWRWLWCGLGVLLPAVGGWGAQTLSLSADRKQIPADGISTITIIATVRQDASLSASGLIVKFVTTQGELTSLSGGAAANEIEVPVLAGTAKCLLRSTTFETTSVVTGFLVGERIAVTDRLQVSFGSHAADSRFNDNIVRCRGDYLRYGPEASYQVLEIIGNAVVSYQGIEVHASQIQIDLQDYVLLAKDLYHGVVLANQPPPYDEKHFKDTRRAPYRGEYLAMDLRTQTGSLYSTQTAETIFFTGAGLVRQPDRQVAPGTYDLFDLENMKTWIEARSALVYPFDKVRLDRARFYVNGIKVFSLPYHFEGLGYKGHFGPALSQVVNYSSRDGFIIDFPYYFDVGDRHTNEIRVTRGVLTGLFGRTTGTQVNYAHHTDLKGGKGSFDFVVDDVLGSFGAQYSRQQRFGPTTYGTFSLAWPRHSNLYSNGSLYTPAGPGNVNLSYNLDYLNDPLGLTTGFVASGNVVWQSDPVVLKPLGSSLSGSVGYSYSHSVTNDNYHRQSASLSLAKDPWRLGRNSIINSTIGLRFQNTLDADRELGFTFNSTFRQQLSRTSSASVGYTYDTASNTRYKVADRHLLTANWQVFKERLWNGYAYTSYELLARSLSVSGMLDYTMTQHWGVAGQSLYQSSTTGSFAQTEFWVYRYLGARQARLRYSIEQGTLVFEIDNNF